MKHSFFLYLLVLARSTTTFGFSNNIHFVNNKNERLITTFVSPLKLLKQKDVSSAAAENKNNNDNNDDNDTATEMERLQIGWDDLVTGRAFDGSDVSKLYTPEDIIGVVGHLPLIFESIRTALTGQLSTSGYLFCAATTLTTCLAHLKMTVDTPRDFRAPRLAEYRSVYEFSALYLIPFSWLIYRITDAFPKEYEVADPVMAFLFSAVTIYGFAYAFVGKKLLEDVNDPNQDYRGILQPSSKEYQDQAQLYLTGNIAINGLACLFIPFAWTLTFRGTDWWQRVQHLHPNQAAFLGLSLLVATVGDVSGTLLLRLKELDIVKSPKSIVVMGILSNFWLLLFPEIVFNGIYFSGVSEIGFYFE